MSEQTTGAVLIVGGSLALIMAVKGSWRAVWHALVPSAKAGTAETASYTFGPGGIVSTGGPGVSGTGRPGAAPAPLARPAGGLVTSNSGRA